jgi:hypothetical protein
VNARIQELTAPGEGLAGFDLVNEYVCECGNSNCRTNISLTWEEFAEIAVGQDQYLVAARPRWERDGSPPAPKRLRSRETPLGRTHGVEAGP